METTINRTKSIYLGPIKHLGLGEDSYTRVIYFIDDDDNRYKITCFGTKGNLGIEIENTKKVIV